MSVEEFYLYCVKNGLENYILQSFIVTSWYEIAGCEVCSKENISVDHKHGTIKLKRYKFK